MKQSGLVTHQNPSEYYSGQGFQDFPQIWAERYIQPSQSAAAISAASTDVEKQIAQTLHDRIRAVSLEVWDRPEILLARQSVRRQMYGRLADPVTIPAAVQDLYSQALQSYAQGLPADRLSIQITETIGAIRARFTAIDPRVLGFVNMQFHYMGQQLLTLVPSTYQAKLSLYFQAIGDQLYMPLHRAYVAATSNTAQSLELGIFHRCLPLSRTIAQVVFGRVLDAFPNHHCYGGGLSSGSAKASSIRDVEMFQAYLWVCLLEGDFGALRRELFPLCALIYPILNVRWELVRYMLMLLGHEMGRYLEPAQWKLCRKHLNIFQEICAGNQFYAQSKPA